MKALVVYDSTWGNTERIANAIAAGIGGGTKAQHAGSMETKGREGIDLLVLGSPVLGGRPSAAMQRYVDGISTAEAKKLTVATFDTRIGTKLTKLFGYAAVRIAGSLKAKGFVIKAAPEGFIVKGRSGPLADGEVERATQWGRALAQG